MTGVKVLHRLDHLEPVNNDPTVEVAGAGAEYIEVNGSVVNSGKAPIDPWCSYAIAFVLVDSRERNFTPIDDLYRIPGNVDCNEMVQPGFRMTVHVVFRVPAGTKASGLVVFDPNQAGDSDGHKSHVTFTL
jgi:hypothetical protein